MVHKLMAGQPLDGRLPVIEVPPRVHDDDPALLAQALQRLPAARQRLPRRVVAPRRADRAVEVDAQGARFQVVHHAGSTTRVLRCVPSLEIDVSSYSESPLMLVVDTSSKITPVSLLKLWSC